MTQLSLKLIAMLAMLLDHTAKILLSTSSLHTGLLAPWIGMENEILVKNMMIILGRMAFPIFAWFVAEGCRKTRDLQRYALRLLTFAVLSEIPFQLCFYRAWEVGLKLACHNVMFTFLLAVSALLAASWLETHTKLPKLLSCLLPACVATVAARFLKTDYNAWGVILVLGLFYLSDQKGRLLYLAAWITVFQLIWHGWNGSQFVWLSSGLGRIQILYWLGALASVALLATYNGSRGRSVKWLFYIFYPLHLLILFLLSLAI